MAGRTFPKDTAEYSSAGTTGGTGNGKGPITAGNIRARWDDSQRATLKERRDFWINASMLAGEQWLYWADGQLQQMPRDGERVRVSVNRLWPNTRTVIAKLLRRPLIFEVAPSSADDAASGGARIATAVLTDTHVRHRWEHLRRDASYAMWKGGTAVLATEWDPKAGVPLGESGTGAQFGTGDTVECCLDVTQVATEPGARDLEQAYWWIKAVALPPRVVKDMYRLDELPPADAGVMLSPLQRSLVNADRGVQAVPLTLVLTYYERPGPEHAKGQVATVVASQLVDGPHPWPFPFTDRLNCVVMRETPIDGRWTGDTIVSAAVPVQVALNQSWSSIVEHMKLAGNARLAIPAGSGEEWNNLSDMPSETVEYLGQQPPSWISPPSMPQWWIEQPTQLEQRIDDILGVHDISRGETPAGGPNSGIGLTILSEQDDTPLGLMAKESAEAWGRLATLVLEIYADKVTEPRKARVQRQGTAPEVVKWTGKQLADQTTASVPLDAVAPRSRASQMQLALQLKTEFPDLDIKTFARIADLPDAQDLVEAIDMDVVKARRENGEMAADNVVVPASFDDDAKHINEHNNFRKTARYESLPGTPAETAQILAEIPEAEYGPKTIVDAHILGHQVNAARKMGAQLAKAQVSPALAGAAQADEPPLAGDHAALLAGVAGSMTNPAPPTGAPAAPGAPPADANADQTGTPPAGGPGPAPDAGAPPAPGGM